MIEVERYTKNFAKWEFLCRHCGAEKISMELVHILQDLRDFYKRPIHIISGYRCPYHPLEMAKPNGPGYHSKGVAVDFIIGSGYPMVSVWNGLMEELENGSSPSYSKIRGMGFDPFKGFIHIDLRDTPTLVTWDYDENGKAIPV